MTDNRRERLHEAAKIQGNAERAVDKFFHRAPFIYTVLLAFALGMFGLGGWVASVSSRIGKIEDMAEEYKKEKIVETVHQNKREIRRNSDQIFDINKTVYGVGNPGRPPSNPDDDK